MAMCLYCGCGKEICLDNEVDKPAIELQVQTTDIDTLCLLQKLTALDLYCGCGGLSFLDGVYGDDNVAINTKWAVDFDQSCCYSFQANYPQAQASAVTCMRQLLQDLLGA